MYYYGMYSLPGEVRNKEDAKEKMWKNKKIYDDENETR